MQRKKLFILLGSVATLLFVSSCISRTDGIDLDKDIKYDMHLGGETLSIPMGSLDTIYLDSLIKIKEGESITKLENGVYAISVKGDIDKVGVDFSDVTVDLSVPSFGSFNLDFSSLDQLINAGIINNSIFPIENRSLAFDLTNSEPISVNQKVDEALVSISSVELDPANIAFGIQMDIPSMVSKIKIDNLIMKLPNYLKVSLDNSNDGRVSLKDGELVINGDFKAEDFVDNIFYIKDFVVNEVKFSEPKKITDDGYLVIDEQNVSFSGKMNILISQINGIEDLNVLKNNLSIKPILRVDPLSFKKVTGNFDPQINPIHEEMNLNIDEDLDFLKDEKNTLTLTNPIIEINVQTSVSVPISLDVLASSKSENGNIIASISKSDVVIPGCPIEEKSHTYTLVFSRNSQQFSSNDSISIQMEDLSQLTRTIPNFVIFDIKAKINKDNEYTLDISDKNISISGKYDVTVPFEFDEVSLNYEDVVDGLYEDMEDVSDVVIDETELQIMANVESTIPLKLYFSAIPIDKFGNKIEGISIDPCEIDAGSENTPKTTALKFKLKVAAEGLKNLDGLNISITCSSTDNSNCFLKNTQYLKITDMVVNIIGGVEVDLTDKIND